MPEQDGALRVTGLPLPRISDLAHDADVRLWELSPHQASLEEAYMRMTQGAVDYRSTADQLSGFQQPGHPAAGPPEMPQQGWYAPPPPGQNPYAAPPAPAAPAAPPTAPPAAAPAPAPAPKDLR